MTIEMDTISIYNVENDVIYGCFRLINYKNLRVEFKFKNGKIEFSYPYENEKEKKYFSKWLSKEKDFYAPFILNYLNEIEQFNQIPFSEGEIVREIDTDVLGKQCYMVTIKYKELPDAVDFKFYPSTGKCSILYQFPIPINSEGRYSTSIHLEYVLTKETIERMWEPFRSKTKYRMELLHMLR